MRKRWALMPMLVLVAFLSMGIVVTPSVVYVDTTTDLQAAVDALPAAGGEIRLGEGTYTLTSTLRLNKPVLLRGQGHYSTYLYGSDPDSDIVRVAVGGCIIRDLSIYGPSTAGEGIGLVLRADSGSIANDFLGENVVVHSTGSWCCAIFGPGYMDTTLAGGWSGDFVSPTFNRCTLYDNKGGGTLYVGHGVSSPGFNDCNFTGWGYTTPVGGTTLADSIKAWHWHATLPAYHDYEVTALHRGHVYLCCVTAARFNGCIFQTASTGNTDEPVLSLEDTQDARFVNSYFESFGASNTRQQPYVTMSAAQGFVFENTYALSNYQAPFHFLRTNSNPSSSCSGIISNFHGIHGSATGGSLTPGQRQNDFVFNTVGDGAGRDAIVLHNAQILARDSASSYNRDVDIRQYSGGTGFYAQNVLPQNTSNRFRLPTMPYDSLTSVSTLRPGELIYADGGAAIGSLGGLLLVAGTSFMPIKGAPVLADTAAREALFTSPLAGDQCFIGNYYGSNLGSYQVYDGTAWRHLW